MANKKDKGVVITATFDKDSKKYHRYLIDEGQKVVGMIYVPKGKSKEFKKVTVKLLSGGD